MYVFFYSHRGSPWTGSGALGEDRHGKDIAFLDQYSMERWEVSYLVHCLIGFMHFELFLLQCVLHYMAGSKEGASGVSRDVVHILLHSGLMKRCVHISLVHHSLMATVLSQSNMTHLDALCDLTRLSAASQ